MSIPAIRRALEKHLDEMVPPLPTAWENVSFKPPADGSAYQESRLMPADPITPMDTLMFIEQGVYQVTLCYPNSKGPGPADARAQAVRSHFARGTSLTVDGVTTIITRWPVVAASVPGDGQWRVPVTIYWQAQVSG